MGTSALQLYANNYAELVAKNLAVLIFDTQQLDDAARAVLIGAAVRIHESAMEAATRIAQRAGTNNNNGKGRKMRNSSKKPSRKDKNIVPNAGKKTPAVKRGGKATGKTKKCVARK